MRKESKIAEGVVASMYVAWGNAPLDRGFYVPKDVDVEQVTPEGTDLDIRIWEKDGKLFGVAFAGKANRPLWNYRFRDRNQLDQSIKKSVDERKGHTDKIQQRQQERKDFKHAFEVGDILYSSWGYDQTNISWFQVVESKDRSVIVREIGSKNAGGSSVLPDVDKFIGSPMVKLVKPGDRIRINSYSTASKWDGKSKYETPIGEGH